MTFFSLLLLGIAPSAVWLLFYLRQDAHPEPNWMIRKVFLWGMLAAIPAIGIELMFKWGFTAILPFSLFPIVNLFLGVALTEEFLKYAVVRLRVLNGTIAEEPLDVMLYMIIAALGFSAFENILLLFGLGPLAPFRELFLTSVLRFGSATLLHALASGLLGFFLARSLITGRGRIKNLIFGLAAATFLHGLFNFSILELDMPLQILVPGTILITLAVFVLLGFRTLRNTPR
ncbi:PrsW family intramembrane metalloprotease [Patescibacteria group bacterium]|nr:PrsW family intramembrane metalloprotease [Patescibacteria group bacterium]